MVSNDKKSLKLQDLADGIEILKLTRFFNNIPESDIKPISEANSFEFKFTYIENKIESMNKNSFLTSKSNDQIEIF